MGALERAEAELAQARATAAQLQEAQAGATNTGKSGGWRSWIPIRGPIGAKRDQNAEFHGKVEELKKRLSEVTESKKVVEGQLQAAQAAHEKAMAEANAKLEAATKATDQPMAEAAQAKMTEEP